MTARMSGNGFHIGINTKEFAALGKALKAAAARCANLVAERTAFAESARISQEEYRAEKERLRKAREAAEAAVEAQAQEVSP